MANIDFLSNYFSDNIRIARSKLFIEPTDGTYNAIRIPKFALVMEVWLEKTVAYGDAGASITVGFLGNGEVADPDGFMDAAICDADAAEMVKASEDTQPKSQGMYFDSASGMVTITCDDNAGTVGTFQVFALYSVIH